MKYLLSFALLLVAFTAYSQFRLTSPLGKVEQSGYYNILLPPEVEAVSEVADLGDLRIRDHNGVNVAYLVHSETPVRTISSFEGYTLKENKVKDSLNIVVVDNAKTEMIDRFYILVATADVAKFVSVRGSDDLSQWYIVKQYSPVSGSISEFIKGAEMLYVDIPANNYRYFEITLSNTQSSPLKVQQVGQIENSDTYGQFSPIDFGTMVRTDSTNQLTYLRFPDIPFAYHVAKVVFYIGNQTDYLRTAYLKDPNRTDELILSSLNANVFYLNNWVASPKMEVVINNGDNRALDIDSVRMYSLNRYVCAYLEKDQEYVLYAGNGELSKPNYDIEHFRENVPDNIPVLKVGTVTILNDENLSDNARKISFIERPAFMWAIIIIVGLLLIVICVKMISDMKAD